MNSCPQLKDGNLCLLWRLCPGIKHVQLILLCINPSIITTDASLCQKHQIIVASNWSVSIMQLVTIFMNECHSLRGRDALIVTTGAVTGHWGIMPHCDDTLIYLLRYFIWFILDVTLGVVFIHFQIHHIDI